MTCSNLILPSSSNTYIRASGASISAGVRAELDPGVHHQQRLPFVADRVEHLGATGTTPSANWVSPCMCASAPFRSVFGELGSAAIAVIQTSSASAARFGGCVCGASW